MGVISVRHGMINKMIDKDNDYSVRMDELDQSKEKPTIMKIKYIGTCPGCGSCGFLKETGIGRFISWDKYPKKQIKRKIKLLCPRCKEIPEKNWLTNK